MAMSDFWENELVEIAAYYSVAVLCLVLFLTVFERDEQLLPFRRLNTSAGPADEKRSCPETDSAFR